MSDEERARNRATLGDLSRRISAVRDKLATVAAEAGPLFREVGDISDSLGALLASAKTTAPPTPTQEEIFGDDETEAA